MNHQRLRRREAILADFRAMRMPDEGLLEDSDYATLLENFEDTRGGSFTDHQAFAIVSWADFTALGSRMLEEVMRGDAGLDFDEDGEVMITDPAPANLLEVAADRIPAAADPGDTGIVAARLAFVAGRLNEERTWSPDELARIEAWASETIADRALLDLLLAYPDLGLDVTPAGRVVIVAAGGPI